MITQQIAKQVREVYFGGNWTCSNLKDNLAGVTWQQATQQVHHFNTIATLVYHINYYVSAVLKALQGETFSSNDKYSFEHPPINSPEDWDMMLNNTWADAEKFAHLIEQLPDSQLWEIFIDPKYGTYYRNLQGIVEHAHYHLGQIALIKKIIAEHALSNG